MIVFDLVCEASHRFEGWFGSSGEFEGQRERGLVECPHCGSSSVTKAPMAPSVPAKSNAKAVSSGKETDKAPVTDKPMPPELQKTLEKLAKAQAKALEKSTWVGKGFAEQSREMHYGERDEAAIHGQASLDEAKSLMEEGVPIAPLPFPVAPPEKLN